MKLAARIDLPPEFAQEFTVALDQVENEALEIRRFRNIHRRTAGRMRFAAATDTVTPGPKKFVEHVIFIGRKHQPMIGNPICFATQPDRMLPKLPDGTEKDTFCSLDSCRSQVTLEVVDNLRDHPAPIDRVDTSDAEALLEFEIAGNGFDDVLTIVKHAFESNVENIRVGQRIHLRALNSLILPLGDSMKTLMRSRPRIAYSAADPVSPEVAPSTFKRSSTLFKNALEQSSQQLHREVLERQRRTVGKFKKPEPRRQPAQRRDVACTAMARAWESSPPCRSRG